MYVKGHVAWYIPLSLFLGFITIVGSGEISPFLLGEGRFFFWLSGIKKKREKQSLKSSPCRNSEWRQMRYLEIHLLSGFGIEMTSLTRYSFLLS